MKAIGRFFSDIPVSVLAPEDNAPHGVAFQGAVQREMVRSGKGLTYVPRVKVPDRGDVPYAWGSGPDYDLVGNPIEPDMDEDVVRDVFNRRVYAYRHPNDWGDDVEEQPKRFRGVLNFAAQQEMITRQWFKACSVLKEAFMEAFFDKERTGYLEDSTLSSYDKGYDRDPCEDTRLEGVPERLVDDNSTHIGEEERSRWSTIGLTALKVFLGNVPAALLEIAYHTVAVVVNTFKFIGGVFALIFSPIIVPIAKHLFKRKDVTYSAITKFALRNLANMFTNINHIIRNCFRVIPLIGHPLAYIFDGAELAIQKLVKSVY